MIPSHSEASKLETEHNVHITFSNTFTLNEFIDNDVETPIDKWQLAQAASLSLVLIYPNQPSSASLRTCVRQIKITRKSK